MHSKTKKEAELALARIKLQVSEGTYKQKSAETYQEVYDLWIIQYEKTVEESTFVKTVGYFKNHILPAMGHYRIEKITIAICQKHYNEWATKVQKARTIVRKKSIRLCYRARLYSNNPFTHVETKIKKIYSESVEEGSENFYIKDELITFLEKAKEHLNYKAYALLRLIAYTGMRKSEALTFK
ncbi:site-specific integrase [Rummeliibacillus stabekisii]|uniref:site-specific integrase n=1 Tax=Rummeliibacillus stabekisii TaxID=241244 RepID=UPI00203ED463|nr:site-specific integrase [Rummeliibacillus stabekisii]MCM3317181.1 site-specific integrase [Rummeliibacillus stabekisii]